MAEAVVGPIIRKLFDLLHEEANLFKGVHRDVERLRRDLESIKCFLKDAEARSEREDTNSGVKVWVKQVTEEANRIEDVVDEYIRRVAPRPSKSRFVGFVKKVGRLIKQFKARFGIASEAREIIKSLHEINERKEQYAFGFTSEDVKLNPQLHSILIEEDEVVGIESERDYLKSALVTGESARTVISLVGTGGIGKTTLANQVYDDEDVKKHFNCRAWITVSQSYDVIKLLKSMTRQICIDAAPTKVETEELKELVKSLKQYLKEKRYFVVIDDVWDVDLWEVIRHALPKNDKGSRIIVTTRNDKIGAAACQDGCDIVHKLQPLSEEMAWDLFCKKAFRSSTSGSSCPKELEEASRKIVDKCQGLPLVITAVARLMSTKEKTMLEWQRVIDNISSEFESNHQLTDVSKILSLSYNDLPHHLKSCFLYFGIFPEDYLVEDVRLYKLWIAEGFVMPQKDKLLEDIAKEYLEELVHRNLVQISYLECRGNDKLCKVHDMMREIILPKVDEIGFCQILDKKNTTFKKKYRRLSINGSEEHVKGIVEDSTVRSIFVFNVNEITKSFVTVLFKKFKLLRVLDFTDAPLDSLPKEVGNLFHLKYLNLRNTKVKTLPKSIGNLQNLQMLNLADTLVRELPFKINNFPLLRHFFNRYWDVSDKDVNSYHGVKIPRGIGSLEGLQTLNVIEAYDDLDSINELEKLRQLRVLGISKLTTKTGKAVCSPISKMNHLTFLVLSLISEDETLDLESISSPPRFLHFLFLRGPLAKFPHWIGELHNLFELRLAFSNFKEDPLKFISCLPNLQKLKLHQAYMGEQLHFKEDRFKKLKELFLTFFVALKVVEIDRGALPHLEMLVIGDSPLKEVPTGIEHLNNLKTVRFCNMSEDFVATITPEEGQDYWKVKHVSSITLWTRVQDGVHVLGLRDSDPFNVCCTRHFERR